MDPDELLQHEFLSQYDHTVDDKGRLVLPAPFRDQLKEGLVLTVTADNCLAIHSLAGWREHRRDLARLSSNDKTQRKYSRTINAMAQMQTLDRQGRLTIPAKLRAYAGITKNVAVVGVGTNIEVWDRDSWAEYEADGLSQLAQTDTSFGVGRF